MATESDSSNPHGLPASWRQRLQDLELVLRNLVLFGTVGTGVLGGLLGLLVWWPYSRILLVLVGILVVEVAQLLLDAVQLWRRG